MINEFQGSLNGNEIDNDTKKIYNTKYIIVAISDDPIDIDNGKL